MSEICYFVDIPSWTGVSYIIREWLYFFKRNYGDFEGIFCVLPQSSLLNSTKPNTALEIRRKRSIHGNIWIAIQNGQNGPSQNLNLIPTQQTQGQLPMCPSEQNYPLQHQLLDRHVWSRSKFQSPGHFHSLR